MLGIVILLVAAVTSTHGFRSAPPYVQSREAFAHAKVYVSESLTPDVLDVNDTKTRTHYSYGILAKVLADLVTSPPKNDTTENRPLFVFFRGLPHAWRYYNEISRNAQRLLNEMSQKVSGISSLIDSICGSEGVPQCNARVHGKVLSNRNVHEQPAELLLQLGKVSDSIKNLESTLIYVTENRYEIPYLFNNVETQKFQDLVQDFRKLHELSSKISFRRFNDYIV